MSKTIKEERLRWVLPIVRKEIKLSDAAKVCPYGTRSMERWIAAYKQRAVPPASSRKSFSTKQTL
ncbi:MAG: hypothetical protein A3G11_01395 [Candidatus Lloydbacteria bacterium RIFCSPLOWO2_12_FULL_51_9]|uniref:Uncharacterized protein n=1 Tax=Candidatus Lloydbacteria bacterium RIFCSPLOWO2_12_FULL_51_9 TaxID=1798669 RepID=A0A1G2DS30_9BACT|nr:MAG: hypothetical protein A3G11_01395 [Candidatus Lloydbacteria bacterium RIFCSPLOWO2_12_FULL_51_9]